MTMQDNAAEGVMGRTVVRQEDFFQVALVAGVMELRSIITKSNAIFIERNGI